MDTEDHDLDMADATCSSYSQDIKIRLALRE